MAKLGLSKGRFSFQGERDSAAEEIDARCFCGDTPIDMPGHVPEGAGQRVLGDNAPSDFIRHQKEIADRTIQLIEKGVDLPPNLFFSVFKMVVEIPKPYREAIHNSHFRAGGQPGERPRKDNGFFDRVKFMAPLLAMPRDSLLHLPVKGNGRGEESPFGIVLEAERKSEGALSASGSSGDQSDPRHDGFAPG
jgi:hypothetical protein